MYLKRTPQKNGRIHLDITDSYYDKDKKKTRQITVENLGFLDDLEKIYDDPIAHFQKRVEELKEEKKRKKEPIQISFYPQERLVPGDDFSKNFGYAALSAVYHELGIHTFLNNRQRHSNEEYNANTIMKMLVYSRLLFPASKKSSYENRSVFFENTDYSLDDVYRCLSFLAKRGEDLQLWLNGKIKENYGRDSSLIYYDVTNYYFETDTQDGFRQKGVSKEHRPNPIVQMGLFMDRNGIPITYELFPGNTNDCLTYRPNFGRIKKQFGLGRVISVADKAMTTGDNIWYTINTPTKDGYVFSMSVRGADAELKKYVLDQNDYIWYGEDYKRKSRPYPRTIHVTKNGGGKMNKIVDEKQVVFWSRKYAARAKAEREAAIVKARDLTANPGKYTRATSYGASKYVKKIDFDRETGEILTLSSVLEIDEERLREEEALDGYYVLVTSEMEESDDRIINIYRGLWRIEESFRVTKSELDARPVYVWTQEHIEAHFLTCFVALTIARILEAKLEWKYSVGKIIDSLRRCRCTPVQQNYYLFDYYDDVLKDIGAALGIDFSKRIRSLGDIKKDLGATKKTDRRKNTT